MEENNWIELLNSQTGIQSILQTNQYTKQFGVTLSEEDLRFALYLSGQLPGFFRTTSRNLLLI